MGWELLSFRADFQGLEQDSKPTYPNTSRQESGPLSGATGPRPCSALSSIRANSSKVPFLVGNDEHLQGL